MAQRIQPLQDSYAHHRLHPSFTLRRILLIPFVGQTILVTGLVTYWSLNASQQTIETLITNVSHQTSIGIEQHLDRYLSDISNLNQLNANTLNQGAINPNDLRAVGHFFWQQAQLYDVGYVLFGRIDGRYVDVGQPETYDVDLITEYIDPSQQGNSLLHSYTIDPQGNPLDLLSDPIDYPFHKEAWFTQAIQTEASQWTPVYSWQSPSANPLAIAFSSPVYDANGILIGAIAIEQRLSHISAFLATLSDAANLSSFIVEDNGQLVASSSSISMVEDGAPIQALNSTDPAIQQTAQYVTTHLGGWSTISVEQNIQVLVQGKTHFVRITPWRDRSGLNWLSVVIVPESNFQGSIDRNVRRALFLSALTLLGSTLLGIVVVQTMINTITRFNRSALAIASGDLAQSLARSHIRELDQFGQTFNHMAQQLQQSFTLLSQANTELEQKVERRTAELQTLNHKLHHLSRTDELTQLFNRRYFDQHLNELWQQGQHHQTPLSLIMLDIDYFKRYND